MEIIENIYGFLVLVLLIWSTFAAFKVSKPLAIGVFFLWVLFFPYFALKYWEEARGPVNLFIFLVLVGFGAIAIEYIGL